MSHHHHHHHRFIDREWERETVVHCNFARGGTPKVNLENSLLLISEIQIFVNGGHCCVVDDIHYLLDVFRVHCVRYSFDRDGHSVFKKRCLLGSSRRGKQTADDLAKSHTSFLLLRKNSEINWKASTTTHVFYFQLRKKNV